MLSSFQCLTFHSVRQRDLKTVIANVTDCFSNINPQTIIWKSKVHMMMHLPDDMGRFGPAAGVSTEIQDKFNGVFHAVAIHGNALAPSRDIAVKFASMKGVAHLALGGFYREKGEWKQVGPGVSLIVTQKMECDFGWVTTVLPINGKPLRLRERRTTCCLQYCH